MKKYNRSFRLYQKLWRASDNVKSARVKPSAELVLIDDVCLKADLCETYEDYVRTLCEGMEMLLNANVPHESLISHDNLRSKIEGLGDTIIDHSYADSDQLYVGLFVKLRSGLDWLKVKFYTLVRDMMRHVLDHGLKISDKLKAKIKEHLRAENPHLYRRIFHLAYKLQAS